MGKNGIKLMGIILTAVAAIGFFVGCTRRNARERNEPKKVVTLLDNPSIMDRYMEGVEDYERVEYEQIAFDTGMFDGLGPHDYRFRGIVYLTEDEAARLWDEYDWKEIDAPEFEFDEVDDSTVGDGPWYRSNGFQKDNYKTVNVSFAVFDGEKIVFDIQQI